MRTVVFKDVNIIGVLEWIVSKNTHAYQSDLEYDKEKLEACVGSANCKNRNFLWMSRECGTWMFRESDVYLKDSAAFGTWTYYAANDVGEHPIAVGISVTGKDRKGAIIGDVYLLNYAETVKDVQAHAFRADNARLTYEGGEIVQGVEKYVYGEYAKVGKLIGYEILANEAKEYEQFMQDLWHARKKNSTVRELGDIEKILKFKKKKIA